MEYPPEPHVEQKDVDECKKGAGRPVQSAHPPSLNHSASLFTAIHFILRLDHTCERPTNQARRPKAGSLAPLQGLMLFHQCLAIRYCFTSLATPCLLSLSTFSCSHDHYVVAPVIYLYWFSQCTQIFPSPKIWKLDPQSDSDDLRERFLRTESSSLAAFFTLRMQSWWHVRALNERAMGHSG
jgi:hypothetical protein